MMPVMWIGIAAGVLFLILIISVGYVKAPPDMAYIISGLRRKIIIGKASVRIPFLERLDKLSLKLISVDVKTSSPVPTAEFINIMVDSAVKIKISDEPEKLALAAQNFLNKDEAYIVRTVQDVLEGNMREIVGQMQLSAMVSDRKLFAEKVQENAAPDMARMGLEIVSFNVQNFVDRNGVIEDLGIDNITQIKKTAAIAKAEGERDIQMAQARADEESNNARVAADTQIAVRQNDLAIKQAELKKQADVKQAEADAAYKIQAEEQRRTIEVATIDADIAKTKSEIELRAMETEVKEKALEAQIKKEAEADRYARQQRAEAELYERQKEAEARRYEQEQEALAKKALAEAERFAREQEADGVRKLGLAEAEAIQAKALAEAEGIDKKADAMAKMGQAAVLEMYFKALPEVVKNAAAPLGAVDRITMFGEGNNAKLVRDIMQTTTQVTEGLRESAGIDLKALLDGFVHTDGKQAQPQPPQAEPDIDLTEVKPEPPKAGK